MLLKNPCKCLGDLQSELADAQATLAAKQAYCAALGGIQPLQKYAVYGSTSDSTGSAQARNRAEVDAANAQITQHNQAVQNCAGEIAYWQARVSSLQSSVANAPPPSSVSPVQPIPVNPDTGMPPYIRDYQPGGIGLSTTTTSEVAKPITYIETTAALPEEKPTIPWALLLAAALAALS